jgi:Uma2 family endonuclease
MSAEVIKKRFTVDEYHRMVEAEVIGPKDRVELVDGEVIEMSPIGHRHRVRVIRTTTLFFRAFGDQAIVSSQNSLQLNDWTEPQPDLVVLKPRPDFYARKKFTPEDVLLVMEISDTSLRYDRNVKVPLFAAAGIPEVWIEDAKKDVLYVYRDPRADGYAVSSELQRRDSVSPIAFPSIRFSIDNLVGEPVIE